jgi:AraC-like DNA-binding protein
MKFDVFSLIVLLGALQALFFSIYLFFAPSHNKIQKRSLAFFIFILSYNGFETLNWSSELFKYFPFFELCSFILIFGLGPTIYLYVRSFRAVSATLKNWPHFSILWLALSCRLWILVTWTLQVNGKKVLIDVRVLNDWFCAIAEPLSVLFFTVYLILAIQEYRSLVSEDAQQDNWGPGEKTMVMRWLKTLLLVLVIFNLLWIITVSPFLTVLGDKKYYMIEIVAVIFVYWIGYAGYHRSRVIYVSQQKKTQSYFDNLEAGEIERSLTALERAMEKDQLYLDPELNLNHLAAHLDIHPKMLSAVLNQVLQKGFSEYVNAWRVEAVKRMILDPDKQHLTITGIAYDCGFNSQPTFQRAFKAATGQTPSNYIQNAIQIRN